MPGFVLEVSALVQCAHGGMARPTVPYPRVMLSGMPAVTLNSPYVVAGCSLPPNAGGPCLTAQWVVGASRVMAGGVPLLVQSGSAVCVPTGAPLLVSATQTRVTAS